MPNIWDNDKIVANMNVLCDLFDEQAINKKLDINSDGTLSIYKPTFFGVQFVKRWSSPSITSEENFKIPIIRLFVNAKQNGITNQIIDKALTGIYSLKTTYESDTAKKQAAINLYRRIRGTLTPTGLREFLQDYQQYLTPYSFAQMQYLKSTSKGACMGFTFFWILNKLKDKDWYYRMNYLVDNLDLIIRFHKAYKKAADSRIHKKLLQAAEDTNLGEYYFVATHIDANMKLVSGKKGSEIFEAVIKGAYQCDEPKLFIFTFEGTKPHAMGLDIRNERIDLFDPNFGEVRFAFSQGGAFYSFCDHMWTEIYGAESGIVQYWDLLKFYRA